MGPHFAPLAPGTEWESGGSNVFPGVPTALGLPHAPCYLWSLQAYSIRCAGIVRDQTVEKGVPLIGWRQPDELLRLSGPQQKALIGGTHAALRKLVFVAPSGCQNKPERFIPNRKLSEKPDSFTGNKSLRGWYILSTFSFHSEVLLKADTSQRGSSGFGGNLYWASVAKGKFERGIGCPGSPRTFPCFPRQDRGSSSVSWALCSCPVPAFILLFTCL